MSTFASAMQPVNEPSVGLNESSGGGALDRLLPSFELERDSKLGPADEAKEMQKITPRTSATMARTYQRNAENLEKRAQAEDKKMTDLSIKLGKSAQELATAEKNLSREIRKHGEEGGGQEEDRGPHPGAGGRPASPR